MKKIFLMKLSRKQLFLLALAAAFGLILVSVGGFAFAASQEENDSFCASCHTQPETTFFQRSIAAAAVDLASAHHSNNTRCIDCHSGAGLLGRISAEMMGAQNAVKWYAGSATQPAPLLYPIGDENCVKCHSEVLTERHDSNSRTVNFGPKGHYHAFLAQWKEADKNAANCVSCHLGHVTGGGAQNEWVQPAAVQPVCEACHKMLGSDE
jgi:nitrate/TMAO reductase-like tetraheme cytochrome c subunit